jgi:hypothetical protein
MNFRENESGNYDGKGITSPFGVFVTKSPGDKRKQDGFLPFFAKIHFEKYYLSYFGSDYSKFHKLTFILKKGLKASFGFSASIKKRK